MANLGQIGTNIGISLGIVDRYYHQVTDTIILNTTGIAVGHCKRLVRTDKLLGIDETLFKRTKALYRMGVPCITYLGAQLLRNPDGVEEEERGLVVLKKDMSNFILKHFSICNWGHPDKNGNIFLSQTGKRNFAYIKYSEIKETMALKPSLPAPKKKWDSLFKKSHSLVLLTPKHQIKTY